MMNDRCGAELVFVANRRIGLSNQLHRIFRCDLFKLIVEWIRQCETTFETQPVLRPLLHPDIWPHAGRSSFVTLLSDKHVSSTGVDLKNAVGVRLTFRRPPPIQFFSDQFLFLLNDSLAGKAYETWSSVSDGESASLPPERFHFFVMGDEIQQV